MIDDNEYVSKHTLCSWIESVCEQLKLGDASATIKLDRWTDAVYFYSIRNSYFWAHFVAQRFLIRLADLNDDAMQELGDVTFQRLVIVMCRFPCALYGSSHFQCVSRVWKHFKRVALVVDLTRYHKLRIAFHLVLHHVSMLANPKAVELSFEGGASDRKYIDVLRYSWDPVLLGRVLRGLIGNPVACKHYCQTLPWFGTSLGIKIGCCWAFGNESEKWRLKATEGLWMLLQYCGAPENMPFSFSVSLTKRLHCLFLEAGDVDEALTLISWLGKAPLPDKLLSYLAQILMLGIFGRLHSIPGSRFQETAHAVLSILGRIANQTADAFVARVVFDPPLTLRDIDVPSSASILVSGKGSKPKTATARRTKVPSLVSLAFSSNTSLLSAKQAKKPRIKVRVRTMEYFFSFCFLAVHTHSEYYSEFAQWKERLIRWVPEHISRTLLPFSLNRCRELGGAARLENLRAARFAASFPTFALSCSRHGTLRHRVCSSAAQLARFLVECKSVEDASDLLGRGFLGFLQSYLVNVLLRE
eukprot:ANDGO_02634.mRNA.1 hypothetical protein